MAKGLGQIHTVNYQLTNTAAGDIGLIDLPGKLSEQLQHPVRMMSNFKVTGIDISPIGSGVQTVAGYIYYFAPTQGRVEALKQAWQAAKEMFKTKGIKYWNNLNYDFRPIWQDPSTFTLTGALGTDFGNQASLELDGGGVPAPLCLVNPIAGTKAVFATYNENVEPLQAGGLITPNFSAGFTTVAGTTGDLVVNEKTYLTSRVPMASEEPERIPFQFSIDTTTDEASTVFMWRPDPMLYLNVLCGQLLIDIEMSSEPLADCAVAVHVAGWKSIMGTRKRQARRSSKRTHRGRRHSKK